MTKTLKNTLTSFDDNIKHPSELAELNISMSLRSLGFSMFGVFVPIYLYEQGYSIQRLLLFFTLFFMTRIPISFVIALFLGRFGPKHTIALSTATLVVFMLMLLGIEGVDWPILLLSVVFTLANGLFFVAYHTDFSKIKHTESGGKELGRLYMYERLGSALGPLIGGLLATAFSPRLSILLAIAVMLSSLVPLFMSGEPVRTHQHITFRGFRWRRHIGDYISIGVFNMDNFASVVIWPLLVAVAVFSEGVYAKVGLLTAISMLLSVGIALLVGRAIDSGHSRPLFISGVFINAAMHLCRPFVLVTLPAAVVTAANEPLTFLYRIPLLKGYYDSSDTEEGYRIVYLVTMEMFGGLLRGLFCFYLWVATYYFAPLVILKASFVSVAFISILMLSERFPTLTVQRRRL